jgi:hypothetical protein
MANTSRVSASAELRYFFVDDVFYKLYSVDRHLNLAKAIKVVNGVEGERVSFIWSDLKKNAGRAYTTNKVCKILNCKRNIVKRIEKVHKITPQKVHFKDGDWRGGKCYFSEQQVLDMWEIMANTHHGHPRKDGDITQRADLPTKAEVIAGMHGGQVLYYKDDSGDFVPLFRATM